MLGWIKTVLFFVDKLGAVCRRLDKKVDELSLSLKIETLTLMRALLEVEDIKRRLCNFRVLGVGILNSLCREDKKIIRAYISKVPIEDIALEAGVSKSTVHRRLKRVFASAINYVEQLGFTEGRFEDDYLGIGFIAAKFRG